MNVCTVVHVKTHHMTFDAGHDALTASCHCGWSESWPTPIAFGAVTKACTSHLFPLAEAQPIRKPIPRQVARKAHSTGLAYWKSKSDRYYVGCVFCMEFATETPADQIGAWWEKHYASDWHTNRAAERQAESETENRFFEAIAWLEAD